MIEREFAGWFAAEWIGAWHSRDLERVLSLYTDDFEMISPLMSRSPARQAENSRERPSCGPTGREGCESFRMCILNYQKSCAEYKASPWLIEAIAD